MVAAPADGLVHEPADVVARRPLPRLPSLQGRNAATCRLAMLTNR